MVLTDRAFVAELDLDVRTAYGYRLCIIWIDDDVTELAKLDPNLEEYDPTTGMSYSLRYWFTCVLMKIDAPRCMRFLLQKQKYRESAMWDRMTPLMQQLAEELVQPTDWLDSKWLLFHGQSVKLIGMCVPDEKLVADWFRLIESHLLKERGDVSVPFARKLRALATLDQSEDIKAEVLWAISRGGSNDTCFELAWLFGLVQPFYPRVQQHFRNKNVRFFPALTFAMIVAMCDGYLTMTSGISEPQRRFFTVMERLPMDLQALVSLRLWGRTSTVISSEQFNRAFLAVV
jgi:hypothetical protein